MSDMHAAAHDHPPDHAHDDHSGHISDKTFIYIFGVLLVFTAITFTVNQVFKESSPAINFTLIGIVAVCKATLVMTYFMHLKIDWRKIFVFLIPICILAPMVIMVLWPDMVLAWRLAPDPQP